MDGSLATSALANPVQAVVIGAWLPDARKPTSSFASLTAGRNKRPRWLRPRSAVSSLTTHATCGIGCESDSQPIPQVACVVKLETALRGRSHRGRLFQIGRAHV